jgi:hypothetical protein
MKYARIATLSLLPLCLAVTGCSDDDTGTENDKVPMEGEWETVVDRAIFVHNSTEEVAAALGVTQITYLGIGKAAGDNLVNRGHVEVIYAEDHAGLIENNFDNPPLISVEIRKFTTADSDESAAENLAKSALYAYTQSPGEAAPTPEMDPSWCVQEIPDPTGSGGNLSMWQENCYLTVWYDGLSQPLRDGADIRVTVPADWKGLVEIVTGDNIQDAVSYPRRSDVTIKDLYGDAKVTLESGEAKVRLSEASLEVLTCSVQEHEDCRAARWNTDDAGGCIDADGMDDDGHCSSAPDCAADSECMQNNCFCNPDDFRAIQVTTQDLKAANVTVDLPSDLWTAVQAQNNEPSLSSDSDPLCLATVDCNEFDGCEIDEDNSANEWKQYVELNDLGDDNIEGLGIQLKAESDACANIPVARSPEDLDNPVTEKRGDVRVCSGCLSDL